MTTAAERPKATPMEPRHNVTGSQTQEPARVHRWPSDRRTDRYNWERARGPISAFGESKTLHAWAADERCAVNREALRTRLALGWAPERAITAARHHRPELVFTHNERTLTLRGWADQTGIKYHTLYHRITTSGMTFTEALEKGAEGADFDLPVTAFGETKTLHHWAVETRARCTVTTMRRRLAQGWNPEQAITEEPEKRSALGSGVPHHAFGMSMGLEDWGRHTQIPAGNLRHQIEQHNLTLEAALTSLGWTPGPDTLSERHLLRITPADLRPGDHVLAVNPTNEDGPHLTVRRPRTSPESSTPLHNSAADRTHPVPPTTPVPPLP
ncbi:hypothetical protein OEB94_37810, partial [Streptomyces sp. ICN988]|uniref:hypothetical protein n=1 Tax=Streptomyces sp. ICN988 TaxID=2983765 RepID=UPI0021E4B06D